jgi:selenoprotein W-related protein
LAESLLTEHKQDIAQCVIIPSDGGRFEVSVDGELVFSKLAEGRFPEEAEIHAHI